LGCCDAITAALLLQSDPARQHNRAAAWKRTFHGRYIQEQDCHTMCEAGECVVYEALIVKAMRRRQVSVVALLILLIAGATIGLALLLSTLLLKDLATTSSTEGLRTASGLLVSAFSVGAAKEVLDRWSALAWFEEALACLRRCGSLPKAELEACCAIAKEVTKKV
jgi:hypothetical protein